jgi:hypothetical protein
MKRIRITLAAAVIAAIFGAGMLPVQSASACTGDPCDGICNFWNQHPDLFEKLHLGRSCQLG